MGKLLACCICLVTDVRLYELKKYGLKDLYEALTGYTILETSSALYNCSVCALTLRKYGAFLKTCTESLEFLLESCSDGVVITNEFLKSITGDIKFTPYKRTEVASINIPSTKDTEITKENEFAEELKECSFDKKNKLIIVKKSQSPTINNIDTSTKKRKQVIDTSTKEKKKAFCIFKNNQKTMNKIDQSTENELFKDKTEKVKAHTTDIESDDEKPVYLTPFETKDFLEDELLSEEERFLEDDKKHKYTITFTELAEKVDKLSEKSEKTNLQDASDETESDGEDKNYDSLDMEKLSMEEQTIEFLARKSSSNYINAVYKCDMCFKGYLSRDTYMEHIPKHDPITSGKFTCDICRLCYRTKRSLRKHKYSSHEWKFCCKKCSFISTSQAKAEIHVKLHSECSYKCESCKATFTKKSVYISHLSGHQSRVICEYCGDNFPSERRLKIHKHREHKDFMSLPVYGCLVCEARFTNEDALNKHGVTHGPHPRKGRPCAQCGDNFSTEESLSKHLKDDHKNNELQCYKCNQVFKSERGRSIHLEQDHGVRSRHIQDAPQMKRLEYECTQCDKKFLNKINLKYHQLCHREVFHKGDTLYTCPRCTKQYDTEFNLKIHMRTHRGEHPYRCHLCPKGYTTITALKTHLEMHSGAKIHSCPFCGRKFSSSALMKNHMKLHMENNRIKSRL